VTDACPKDWGAMSRSRVEKTRAARAVRFSERSDIEMRSSLTVAGGDSAPAEGGSSAKKLVKITTSERACKPESSFIEPVSQKLQVLSSSEVISRQSGGMRERKPVVEAAQGFKCGRFGGPGRDRTDDLFHAMEVR